MSYLVLAVASAVLYGSWQFGLGVFRGRVTVWSVILLSASAAAVMYLVLGSVTGDLAFTGAEVVDGLIGGALNVTGTYLLLRAFEHGKLGVATGIAATNVLIPLAYSVINGEGFTGWDVLGIAVIAVGLATFYVPHMKSQNENTSTKGRDSSLVLVLALASAVFWGAAIIVLDLGSKTSVTGTLVTSQMPQIILASGFVLWALRRNLEGIRFSSAAVLVGSGVALALANFAFYTAANEGNIGIASVLASLNPLVTALLAMVFFKEGLSRAETVALVIVVVGASCVVA